MTTELDPYLKEFEDLIFQTGMAFDNGGQFRTHVSAQDFRENIPFKVRKWMAKEYNDFLAMLKGKLTPAQKLERREWRQWNRAKEEKEDREWDERESDEKKLQGKTCPKIFLPPT